MYLTGNTSVYSAQNENFYFCIIPSPSLIAVEKQGQARILCFGMSDHLGYFLRYVFYDK